VLWLLHHYKCCPRGLISSAGPPLIGQHPPILVSDWFQQSLTSVQMLSLQIRSSLLGVLSQQRLVCFALWWHREWPIRGQHPGHVITLDQSEASIRVTWSLWTNQGRDGPMRRPVQNPISILFNEMAKILDKREIPTFDWHLKILFLKDHNSWIRASLLFLIVYF